MNYEHVEDKTENRCQMHRNWNGGFFVKKNRISHLYSLCEWIWWQKEECKSYAIWTRTATKWGIVFGTAGMVSKKKKGRNHCTTVMHVYCFICECFISQIYEIHHDVREFHKIRHPIRVALNRYYMCDEYVWYAIKNFPRSAACFLSFFLRIFWGM